MTQFMKQSLESCIFCIGTSLPNPVRIDLNGEQGVLQRVASSDRARLVVDVTNAIAFEDVSYDSR